jgi:hypothetical protein
MIFARLLDSMLLRCNQILGLLANMLVSVLSVHSTILAANLTVTSASSLSVHMVLILL